MSAAEKSDFYRIADEPHPSDLGRFAVNPSVIFLAYVFAGSWLALPWFVFNSFAIGSVTQKREVGLAALSPAVSLVYAVVVLGAISLLGIDGSLAAPHLLADVLGLPDRAISYAFVFLFGAKMAFAYTLQRTQTKSFVVHRFLGRAFVNGIPLVMVGYFLRSTVIHLAFQISDYLGAVLL